jgi:hypothetical protein
MHVYQHCKAPLLLPHSTASSDSSTVFILPGAILPVTRPLLLFHAILPSLLHCHHYCYLQVFAAVLAGDPPLDRIPGPVPLRDLVTKLLQTDPANRLGTRGGAPAVTSHPFFQGIASATPAPLLPPPGLPEIPDAAVATAAATAAAAAACGAGGGAEGGGGVFKSVRPRADGTDEQQDAGSLAAMFFSDPNAVSSLQGSLQRACVCACCRFSAGSALCSSASVC